MEKDTMITTRWQRHYRVSQVRCTYLLAPVTHYRTFTFPVPRRHRHRRRRPKQSQRNSVASFSMRWLSLSKKGSETVAPSSADAFVSKLLDARRQASTTHWFQSSIWWISPRTMNPFFGISRCKSNAINKILISVKIFQLGNVLKNIIYKYICIMRICRVILCDKIPKLYDIKS